MAKSVNQSSVIENRWVFGTEGALDWDFARKSSGADAFGGAGGLMWGRATYENGVLSKLLAGNLNVTHTTKKDLVINHGFMAAFFPKEGSKHIGMNLMGKNVVTAKTVGPAKKDTSVSLDLCAGLSVLVAEDIEVDTGAAFFMLINMDLMLKVRHSNPGGFKPSLGFYSSLQIGFSI